MPTPSVNEASVPCAGPDAPAVVRTGEDRFSGLPGFPFQPHYVEVDNPHTAGGLRMHYVDEGPRDAPVVLMLHGEPAWSYLYRKMIPVFVAAGLRAIAPDHIGFGRSDKLTWPPHYSFEHHVAWLRQLVATLDLRDITLVCQDWGGPISLAVLARETHRFSRVVAGNTMLHTAGPELAGRLTWAAHASGEENSTVSTLLLEWMRQSQRTAEFRASDFLHFATVRGVPPDQAAAWDAPFPSEWHKAGMRQFPLLIPVTRSDPGAVINQETWRALEKFENPFLTLFGDSDPATQGWEAIFQERVPGARGQPHQLLERAGHFWQEDCGEQAAQIITAWIGADGGSQ